MLFVLFVLLPWSIIWSVSVYKISGFFGDLGNELRRESCLKLIRSREEPADSVYVGYIAAMTTDEAITADEVALYDRQIRLWGMAAQERMRKAHVLVAGVKGLANEVIKNLVLAGIGAVTLLDSHQVTEDDLGCQFFLEETDVGRNVVEAVAEKAQKLNPRVAIRTDCENVAQKDDSFFSSFEVIVICGYGYEELIRINKACRQANRPFYAAGIPGLSGYIFTDLIEHDYTTEKEETLVSGEKVKKNVPHKEQYLSLEEVLKHNYGETLRPKLKKKVSKLLPLSVALLKHQSKHGNAPDENDHKFGEEVELVCTQLGLATVSEDEINTYSTGADCELSPIAAVVGGVLSQDVLNVLSGREFPIQNFFIYDGNTGDGPIYKI